MFFFLNKDWWSFTGFYWRLSQNRLNKMNCEGRTEEKIWKRKSQREIESPAVRESGKVATNHPQCGERWPSKEQSEQNINEREREREKERKKPKQSEYSTFMNSNRFDEVTDRRHAPPPKDDVREWRENANRSQWNQNHLILKIGYHLGRFAIVQHSPHTKFHQFHRVGLHRSFRYFENPKRELKPKVLSLAKQNGWIKVWNCYWMAWENISWIRCHQRTRLLEEIGGKEKRNCAVSCPMKNSYRTNGMWRTV